MHWIAYVCGVLNFVIPLSQLSIGFRYVVTDGQSASLRCQIAPDLPLLLAIGGIFALFFFGTAYGFLKTITSVTKIQSDVAGKAPKILIGLVSFIFGAITFIFFVLIQMRTYRAYSHGVQYNTQSAPTYCYSIIMRGALAMIILTYMNILLFFVAVIIVLLDTRKKVQEKKRLELEIIAANNTHRL